MQEADNHLTCCIMDRFIKDRMTWCNSNRDTITTEELGPLLKLVQEKGNCISSKTSVFSVLTPTFCVFLALTFSVILTKWHSWKQRRGIEVWVGVAGMAVLTNYENFRSIKPHQYILNSNWKCCQLDHRRVHAHKSNRHNMVNLSTQNYVKYNQLVS